MSTHLLQLPLGILWCPRCRSCDIFPKGYDLVHVPEDSCRHASGCPEFSSVLVLQSRELAVSCLLITISRGRMK